MRSTTELYGLRYFTLFFFNLYLTLQTTEAALSSPITS